MTIKTYTEYREHDGTYKIVARRLSLKTLNLKCAASAYYLSIDTANPSKGFLASVKLTDLSINQIIRKGN